VSVTVWVAPLVGRFTVGDETVNRLLSGPTMLRAPETGLSVRLVSVSDLVVLWPLPAGTAPNDVLTEDSATWASTAAGTSSSPAPVTSGSVSSARMLLKLK